jgi:hypothetical protein
VSNTIDDDENDDSFEILPLSDSLNNILSTGFILFLVSVFIDDLVNFFNVFLSAIEFGNSVVDLFGLPLEVFVH